MRYSVLGTGLMGTAVAHALAKSGRDTAVWNRTISRAEPLAKAGVSVHADVGSALDASDAVVLTILDLDSAMKTLDGHFAALEGKAVISLMSGTPALARRWPSVSRKSVLATSTGPSSATRPISVPLRR